MPIGGIITTEAPRPALRQRCAPSCRAAGRARRSGSSRAASIGSRSSAHVGSAVAQGAAIVAIAPGGAEKTLLAIPAAPSPFDIHETVKTGRFFAAAGDYRIELRADGKPLASSTVTIAAGFETAIVNACEPLVGPEKTGPGKTPARTR